MLLRDSIGVLKAPKFVLLKQFIFQEICLYWVEWLLFPLQERNKTVKGVLLKPVEA
jgi:hypothetical protein